MASLKINLFGEFQVWRGDRLIGSKEWDRQKTRSLLKFLLTRPACAGSRDGIIEALWPSASPKAAERSLRVTVSLLRRALEPDLRRGSESRYVLQVRPGYSFNREAHCEVDAWEFDKHRHRAEAACQAEKLDEAIHEYGVALGLVRGEFLAGEIYEEWATTALEAWRECQVSVLSNLAECLAIKGRYTEAVETCNQALSMDRFSENLHRRLMLYHYCSGEQTMSLRVFRSYTRMLKEELDAAPSPELIGLKEHVEARDVPGVDTLRRYPRPRRPLKFPYSLSRTHFAGRDREYALLAERLKEMTGGAGGTVAVEGEAGVGKTRLVEEFLGYAESRGAHVLSGRCYERDLGPPLEPVMETLGSLTATDETNLRAPDSKEKSRYLWQTELHEDNSRIYGAITRKLYERAQDSSRNGLVLFVDDVQWADPATLDFLSYLARRISRERILLVFTYRREQASDLLGWLEGLTERRAVSTLSLDRLSSEDLAQILSPMAARAFDELPSLASFLHRESEGNPFYVVEYLRWLIEAGAVEMNSRRRISGLKSEALRQSVLPSGVRALIRTRFSGLSGETRDLLDLAAIVGRNFDLGLLCEAVSRTEDDVCGIIEPLMSSGLIFETADGGYYFSHDKLRQALYEEIGGRRRRELHLRVAETLEKNGSEPTELAHHYLRAREWRPALENLTRAARKAEESHAWNTASENYARALEIVEKLPDSEEERFGLLSARERLLEHMDRREERVATVQEMFDLAHRLGDHSRIAEVHVRRIGALMVLSDPEGAAEAGREALTIFQKLSDRAGEARAHRELGYVRWMHQDYAGALEANLQALWIHRELGYRRGEAGDAGNIAHVYRSMSDHDSALRWNEEAILIDRELGDKLGEAFRLNSVASIHQARGDLKAALSLHLKSLPLLADLGIKNLEANQRINCGRLYLSLGAPEDALEHFRYAARLGRETGYARDEGYSLMGVGVCLEQIGDFVGAEKICRWAIKLLETSYELSEMPEELSGKADALVLMAAMLDRSLDRPADALEAYEEAVGIYGRLGDRLKLRGLLMRRAGLRWRMGSLEDSARDYGEALDLARMQGEKAHEAAALASLSVVHRDLGALRESLRNSRETLELLRNLEDSQAEAYVLSSMAESHAKLGHHSSALSCLRRSLRLRQKIGDKEGEIGVLHDLAKVYESRGDSERSSDASEEAMSKREALEENCEVISTQERRN